MEPDELDTDRFERRVLEARQATADGHPVRAIPQLTDALDLWRGPALVDVRDLSAARAEILRLEELHAIAYEELAEARLALGEHALVVDVLPTAIRRYPLREKLTACLMVALYRCNRPSDALGAYAELARQLDGQLGVTPSKALRKLEEDVLLQLSSLDFVPSRAETGSPMHLHPPAARMIGRREELRDLLEGLQDSSEHHAFLITGPAGIGKTTFVGELSKRMERKGLRAIAGFCELYPSRPYEPICQLLQRLVNVSSPDDIAPTEVESILRLDESASAPASSEGSGLTARFHVFEAVASYIRHHCTDDTVLIVEDLHWIDRPTLLMLRHILRHPALAHIRFIGTYRDDDIGGERLELIHSLVSPAQCQVMRLRPFLDTEARSLVQTIAPPESVAILADHAAALCDATHGNPFFLRELLRELDDECVKLTNTAELFNALSTIAPVGVRALVDRRLARLSPEGTDLAYSAAILSEGISTELLADICELSPDAVLTLVEECLAARLLVEDQYAFDRFLFPHALVRNAVYVSIPPERRPELHRRTADALVQHPNENVRPATIARHFCEAAVLGLQSEAAKYAELAGSEADNHVMFSQAAHWYAQAIRWLPADRSATELGRLELALGRALANDKQGDRAREAFLRSADAARQAGDSVLLIDVALAADGPWISGSEFRVLALSLLEEALEHLDEEDVDRRVRALVHMASVLYYVDPVREGEVVRQAIELASGTSNPGTIATAQVALHRWLTHDTKARMERLALSREACCSIAPDGQTSGLFLQHQREYLSDLLENAMIPEFQSALLEYEGHAKRVGSPPDIYWSNVLRATEATLFGDLASAEQLARGAALRGYELEQLSDGAFLLQRFIIRYQQARLAEELPVLRQVSKAQSVFRAGAALAATALSETGRHEQANRVVWEALGANGDGLPRDVFWLAAVALFSGVAARGQDMRIQELLSRLLSPYADHLVVFGVGGAVLGSAHYWLGLLAWAVGDHAEATDHFLCAKAAADRIEAPFWSAQAAIEASRVLRTNASTETGDEAEQLAQFALSTAHRLDFGRILRELT